MLTRQIWAPNRVVSVSKWNLRVRCQLPRSQLAAFHSSSSQKQKLKLSYVRGPGNIPLKGLTVGQVFQEAADKTGDNEAVVDIHQKIRKSYRQLLDDADQLAAGFVAMNLKRGDRIGIWGPNTYEWILVQVAAARAGLILVNINPAYKSNELAFALNKVGVKALVMSEYFRSYNLVSVLRGVATELENPDGPDLPISKIPSLKSIFLISDKTIKGMHRLQDVMDSATPALISHIHNLQGRIQFDEASNIHFASGTTGDPKGATLSHHSIVNNSFILGQRAGFHDQISRLCLQVPLYHVFGSLMGVMAMAQCGGCSVLPNPSFSALHSIKAIDSEKCTTVYGTPTMFVDLLNVPKLEEYNVSTLNTAYIAGSPVSEELAYQIAQVFKISKKNLVIGFGMTETSSVTFQSMPSDSLELRCSTLGFPLNNVEIKVIDPFTGEVVPVNTPGEICSRGYTTMIGYWDDLDKTKETITNDNWLHTGDLGTLDENGYGRIVGRIKDLVIRGGENIYPKEVEDLLHTHPLVIEAHVVGVPDARMGEELCAWVRYRPGAQVTSDELWNFCRERVAYYKVPRYWLFKEEFPTMDTGEIDKGRMREVSIRELNLQKGGLFLEAKEYYHPRTIPRPLRPTNLLSRVLDGVGSH